MEIELIIQQDAQGLDSKDQITCLEKITLLPCEAVTIKFDTDNSVHGISSSELNEPAPTTFQHSKFQGIID